MQAKIILSNMSETQLLNLLNHYLIREFQNSGPEGMGVNEFLPLCAALVYPYRNEKIELTKDIITPIITSVQNFTRKKDLVQYISFKDEENETSAKKAQTY